MNGVYSDPITIDEQVLIQGEMKDFLMSKSKNYEEILWRFNQIEIIRIIKEHPIHPIFLLIYKIKNTSNRLINSLHICWKMQYEGHYYFILEIENIKANRPNIDIMLNIFRVSILEQEDIILNISLDNLLPNEERYINVELWALRSFNDTIGFSGVGFLVNSKDINSAICALSVKTRAFPSSEIFYIFNRCYSPILWVESKLDSAVLDVIAKSTIKLVISLIALNKEDKEEIIKLGIKLITLNWSDKNLIEAQKDIDELLNIKSDYKNIVVLPADIKFLIPAAYYVPLQNAQPIIYTSDSIINYIEKYIPKSSTINVVIDRDSEQIPSEFLEKLAGKNYRVLKLEEDWVSNCEGLMHAHSIKYSLSKMIINKITDPSNNDIDNLLKKAKCNIDDIFIESLQKVDELIDLINPEVNGPPAIGIALFSIDNINNAIVAAAYAKSRMTYFLLFEEQSLDAKEKIKDIFEYLSENYTDKIISYWNLLFEKVASQVFLTKVPRSFSSLSEGLHGSGFYDFDITPDKAEKWLKNSSEPQFERLKSGYVTIPLLSNF